MKHYKFAYLRFADWQTKEVWICEFADWLYAVWIKVMGEVRGKKRVGDNRTHNPVPSTNMVKGLDPDTLIPHIFMYKIDRLQCGPLARSTKYEGYFYFYFLL